MMGHFNYNGKFYKENIPIIGASNRGLRYGYGLFETLKCINGELVLPDEHFARLWKGMNLLQFEIPRHFHVRYFRSKFLRFQKHPITSADCQNSRNNHECRIEC